MNVYVNGVERQVPEPTTLADVLPAAAGEAAPRGVAVALDGEVVPRGRHASTALHDGARVEIVTAVQGG